MERQEHEKQEDQFHAPAQAQEHFIHNDSNSFFTSDDVVKVQKIRRAYRTISRETSENKQSSNSVPVFVKLVACIQLLEACVHKRLYDEEHPSLLPVQTVISKRGGIDTKWQQMGRLFLTCGKLVKHQRIRENTVLAKPIPECLAYLYNLAIKMNLKEKIREYVQQHSCKQKSKIKLSPSNDINDIDVNIDSSSCTSPSCSSSSCSPLLQESYTNESYSYQESSSPLFSTSPSSCSSTFSFSACSFGDQQS